MGRVQAGGLIAGARRRAAVYMVDLMRRYCMAVWLSGYARRSVSYGENYSDGTQRSVSYGEDTVRLLYMVHVLLLSTVCLRFKPPIHGRLGWILV